MLQTVRYRILFTQTIVSITSKDKKLIIHFTKFIRECHTELSQKKQLPHRRKSHEKTRLQTEQGEEMSGVLKAATNELETVQDENLEKYLEINLTEELEFVNNGYKFERSPESTAVTIGQTCMKMNNGRDRGYSVEAFPYLLDNFVLTFLVARTTMLEPVGPERQYMLGFPGAEGRPTFHLLDMDPSGLTGTVNLINCALPHKKLAETRERLVWSTTQVMRQEHCGLVYNTSCYTTPENKVKYPFYMSLNKGSSNKNPEQRVEYYTVLSPGREILME